MENKELMFQHLDRITSENEEIEILNSVNSNNNIAITRYRYSRGSINNVLLGVLISATVIAGVVIGYFLSR